jgi:hypothetical protein
MPYNMSNAGNDFYHLMDEVVTGLATGEMWHEKAANEFRKIGVRGFGRWSDAESKGDYKSRVCLEKLLRDYMDYSPMIDMAKVAESATMSMGGMQDLKKVLQYWYAQEMKYLEALNMAFPMAAQMNICIYKELVCLTEEVQNEAMRVKLCINRLDLAGWAGHDIGVVSMILHEFFESHEGDDLRYINVNLG